MFLYWFLRFFCLILGKFFFHLEARGREFIPRQGGFVLVSNHASFLDPIILGVLSPRVLSYAARDSLFRNKLFAALLSEICVFPIKRWSADLGAVKESVRRLKNNSGLVVFPEGTRSPNGEIQNFTYGFVLLAHKAAVPIIPAWISGSNKAWGKGRRLIRPAKIKVVFGRPLNTEGRHIKGKQDYARISQDVFEQIKLLGCACP